MLPTGPLNQYLNSLRCLMNLFQSIKKYRCARAGVYLLERIIELILVLRRKRRIARYSRVLREIQSRQTTCQNGPLPTPSNSTTFETRP